MSFWKLHGKINLFLINYKLTNFVRSWTKWLSLKEYVIRLLNDKLHCLSLYAYGDHEIF